MRGAPRSAVPSGGAGGFQPQRACQVPQLLQARDPLRNCGASAARPEQRWLSQGLPALPKALNSSVT
eukprot:CAMPEP_0171143844 /NCGR_PEP_ID=MMETSP0766_2-20121228/144950_1 /TAXON_ID=439317 /ORGANISM="Gambierdiscus australes, Strain CAWD 149" /LENGTH=66 /DNA_ID=CAMNT_0011607677 /DNA_START=128 /DNA_END=325 /DNA_ORIENTATION=+